MLTVERLSIKKADTVVVDYGFSVKKSLAIVGESGSGKSMTLKALLGMTPKALQCDMSVKSDFELLRGVTVGFVPQSPTSSLSPMSRLGKQFFCMPEEAAEAMNLVGLDEQLLNRYPNELSGGQMQRCVVAMAISQKPKLLLLDEPTTALDKSSKEHIVRLLVDLRERLGFLMIFVTHEMDVAAQSCEEICVLRHGHKIEDGVLAQVLQSPQNDYTKELIAANFANRKYRE